MEIALKKNCLSTPSLSIFVFCHLNLFLTSSVDILTLSYKDYFSLYNVQCVRKDKNSDGQRKHFTDYLSFETKICHTLSRYLIFKKLSLYLVRILQEKTMIIMVKGGQITDYLEVSCINIWEESLFISCAPLYWHMLLCTKGYTIIV